MVVVFPLPVGPVTKISHFVAFVAASRLLGREMSFGSGI